MPHDVFISHSTDDKLVALALCNKLESAGVRCWIAPRDVGPGAEWGKAIVDAISSCRLMVLVFSSKANDSRHIRREVQTAFEKDLIVIPFRVENTQPTGTMEYYLGSVHWLDALTPPVENHLMGVVERVKALLPAAVQETVSPTPELESAGASSSKPKDDIHAEKISDDMEDRFKTPNQKENHAAGGLKNGASWDGDRFSAEERETLLYALMWVYSAVVWVDGAPKPYEKEALNRELGASDNYKSPLFRQLLEASRAEWNTLLPRWNADARNTPDGLRDVRRILDAKLSAEDARTFKECLYQFGRAIAEAGGERGQGGGVLQMPKVSFDEQDTLIDISIMLGLQEGLRPTSPWLASMTAALDERAVPAPDKVPAVLEPAAPLSRHAHSRESQTSPQPQSSETRPAGVIPSKSKEVLPTEFLEPSISTARARRGPSFQKIMLGLGAFFLLIVLGAVLNGIVLRSKPHARTFSSHVAPAGWKTYNSTKEKFGSDMQPHLVAFSFDYPASFVAAAQPEERYFVRLYKYAANGTDVMENFDIAWYDATGDTDKERERLLDDRGKGLVKTNSEFNCKECRKFQLGQGEIGNGRLWELTERNRNAHFVGGVEVIYTHPPGNPRGVQITLLGTWKEPMVKSAFDVGENDGLAAILRSFKFL